MSSNFSASRAVRRLKPVERIQRLYRRGEGELNFVDRIDQGSKVLLDTTIYVDQLQKKLPESLELSLKFAIIWHSSVTACELCVLLGLLDPLHPGSARSMEEVTRFVDKRQEHRTINPTEDSWIQAGILAGLLARLQQYGKAEQRRALNDALIFLSAAKAGLTVLTRNVADYDLLMQLAPQGRAIFYRV